jgi:putative colanic acid biosynthesis glycosyltransferase
MILSIITINYNEADSLNRTLQYVKEFKAATNLDLEHIVVDGGSSDHSISVLTAFNEKYLRYVSEKDKGIYDAMNKGVDLAIGDFLIFINAGDDILPDPSFNLKDLLIVDEIPKNIGGFAFSVIYNFYSYSLVIKSREVDLNNPRMPGIHQGIIYRKDLFKKYRYSTSFKICGDYDHMARLLKDGYVFKPINSIIAQLQAGGISTQKPFLLYRESNQITNSYFQLQFLNLLKQKLSIIKSLFFLVLIYNTTFFLNKFNLNVKR